MLRRVIDSVGSSVMTEAETSDSDSPCCDARYHLVSHHNLAPHCAQYLLARHHFSLPLSKKNQQIHHFGLKGFRLLGTIQQVLLWTDVPTS
jgi:hypothetical protein